MNKIRLPKKMLILYLIMAPLSCLIFIVYYGFGMVFSCILAYALQVAIGYSLFDLKEGTTREIYVSNDIELDKLDAQYRKIRFMAVSIIGLTIILDTFPFWATFQWFCYNMSLHMPQYLSMPKYDGGLLVYLMNIIIILFWIFVIKNFKSPSSQYYQNVRNNENQRKRQKEEALQAKTYHEHNVSLYGEGYKELCTQFIFNENEKKVWLCQTEYSFDVILDAEIEDIVT